MKVLLVEPDRDKHDLLTRLLIVGGVFDVATAGTWDAAMASDGDHDLLLLPFTDPGTGAGPERFSGHVSNATIVVTAVEMTEAQELAALRAGAQEVLRLEGADRVMVEGTLCRALARREASTARAASARTDAEDNLFKGRGAMIDGGTARSLGIVPLTDAAPKLARRLAEQYADLLDASIRSSVYRDVPRPSTAIRDLTDEMARLRLGPREVTDIHANAIRLRFEVDVEVTEVLQNEGRLLLVTVMGYLLGEYRTQLLAVRSPMASIAR